MGDLRVPSIQDEAARLQYLIAELEKRVLELEQRTDFSKPKVWDR